MSCAEPVKYDGTEPRRLKATRTARAYTPCMSVSESMRRSRFGVIRDGSHMNRTIPLVRFVCRGLSASERERIRVFRREHGSDVVARRISAWIAMRETVVMIRSEQRRTINTRSRSFGISPSTDPDHPRINETHCPTFYPPIRKRGSACPARKPGIIQTELTNMNATENVLIALCDELYDDYMTIRSELRHNAGLGPNDLWILDRISGVIA